MQFCYNNTRVVSACACSYSMCVQLQHAWLLLCAILAHHFVQYKLVTELKHIWVSHCPFFCSPQQLILLIYTNSQTIPTHWYVFSINVHTLCCLSLQTISSWLTKCARCVHFLLNTKLVECMGLPHLAQSTIEKCIRLQTTYIAMDNGNLPLTL